MNEQLFEELAKSHPDLFQKAHVENIECHDGWYNIINVLCGLIDQHVMQARSMLMFSRERNTDNIEEWEKKLEEEVEKLPAIAQVKEKFGGLRFYVHGGTDVIHDYITFAESMASFTCERCGNVGKRRQGSWIKTLCQKHYEETDEYKNEALKEQEFLSTPKLSDETDLENQ